MSLVHRFGGALGHGCNDRAKNEASTHAYSGSGARQLVRLSNNGAWGSGSPRALGARLRRFESCRSDCDTAMSRGRVVDTFCGRNVNSSMADFQSARAGATPVARSTIFSKNLPP